MLEMCIKIHNFNFLPLLQCLEDTDVSYIISETRKATSGISYFRCACFTQHNSSLELPFLSLTLAGFYRMGLYYDLQTVWETTCHRSFLPGVIRSKELQRGNDIP